MTWLKTTVHRFGSTTKWVEEILLCVLLTTMIILGCLQIVLRDLFASGLLWIDPLLRYLVIWSGLLGAVVATRQGKHIVIDISSHLLPGSLKPWLHLAINIFAAGVCLVLTYASVIFVQNEATYGGGRELLGLESWVFNLIFPVAFGLISWRFLRAAVVNLFSIFHTGQSPPPRFFP
jgi:TRAP-type C4-dicarboxylate transport system permease small subunit